MTTQLFTGGTVLLPDRALDGGSVLVRDGRRLARIVPEEDAWVYSPAWQERLREAEANLVAGRVQRFEDDDEFLGHLDALADEAGG